MYSVFSRVCTCVCYLACGIQIYGMCLKILELLFSIYILAVRVDMTE